MPEQALFPAIEPNRSGMLRLDGAHAMYWEECGNPRGIPVVFLHGGPGAGCTPLYRRFFDPQAYQIVLFDQRGAGRSAPHAELKDNTTQNLLSDIERLRAHLGVERWLVFGGSWGSTLALAYGQAHPRRCLGFVLRGIFLGTAPEVDWFLHGMGAVFPEAARAFREALPEGERDDLLRAYHRRLTHADPAVHLPAAKAWSRYESACSTLRPPPAVDLRPGGDHAALAISRIEAHYFVNDMFLRPGQLLGGVDRIRHLPAVIVQGRYDMICPIVSADRLARAWPEADYRIIPDAGHSALEPGVRGALLEATDAMRIQAVAAS
ncbi:MAG: prolyl aminopeptidase [Alphaproteobacteria bacterium]